jgi:ferredoxin-NADP reductase
MEKTIRNFKKATTSSHLVLATTFHFFVFETEKPFNFLAGQYISVKVSQERFNCYSLAGQTDPHSFSLLVDIAPGGPGSVFFQNLKVGEKIMFLGPAGSFTLRLNDGAKHLLFLATGCGLAPLKCMIEEALNKKGWKKPMTLYFGLSRQEDLFMEDYFTKLTKIYPNFNYKIAVWKPNKTWKGPIGFITQFLKTDLPEASSCSAYLCGNQNMIIEATNILKEQGLPKERIYTEKY